jgi:hypothetical protein
MKLINVYELSHEINKWKYIEVNHLRDWYINYHLLFYSLKTRALNLVTPEDISDWRI